MTRFGGFLTEQALYFRVRQSQIVKCKFLISKYSILYTFTCILEYHNSDQFQLLCARCKLLVYVSDYFRVTRS